MLSSLSLSLLLAFLQIYGSDAKGSYVPFKGHIEPVVKSPLPHSYVKSSDLPKKWDWRNVNGTNYCSKVMTQQSPAVCGSCWAEAATGALSDRYTIATAGKLRMQLAPQQLLNFNPQLTGGSCNGGDAFKAFDFIHKYGIADDTCAVFEGVDAVHGFHLVMMKDAEEIKKHQCYLCDWNGVCNYESTDHFDLYGVDEFGTVSGVEEMKAEIYTRGPIACSINSEPASFDEYHGGIIKCDDPKELACRMKGTDHVIIIAGWGVDDATGTEFWVGRNSYGSRWGEGAGGGWFRMELGKNILNTESSTCVWAVPAKASVDKALAQFDAALGL